MVSLGTNDQKLKSMSCLMNYPSVRHESEQALERSAWLMLLPFAMCYLCEVQQANLCLHQLMMSASCLLRRYLYSRAFWAVLIALKVCEVNAWPPQEGSSVPS